MIIAQDTIVSFHYRLSDAAGDALEDSYDDEPVAVLLGHKNIIVGLEEAMEGKQAGDTFTVSVAPEKAYGIRREGSQQRIPIKHLMDKNKRKLKPGAVVTVQTEQGPRQVTVVKAGKFNIDVDTNHPFAGKTLNFEVEIIDVREASAEEKAHGHAHGAGGHHH